MEGDRQKHMGGLGQGYRRRKDGMDVSIRACGDAGDWRPEARAVVECGRSSNDNGLGFC